MMFGLMFTIVPIIVVAVFVFVFAMMFTPKLRGKMMSRQVKSMKYIMDESKGDIESISTDMAEATKTGKKLLLKQLQKELKNALMRKKQFIANIVEK